jgi:hypothetical protein
MRNLSFFLKEKRLQLFYEPLYVVDPRGDSIWGGPVLVKVNVQTIRGMDQFS